MQSSRPTPRRETCLRGKIWGKKKPPSNSGWRVTGRDPQKSGGRGGSPARVGGTRATGAVVNRCASDIALAMPTVIWRLDGTASAELQREGRKIGLESPEM